ncbi:MAG: uracil-DNA glycosylase family protein [Thiogranum sp.]
MEKDSKQERRLQRLLEEVRACRVCESVLPFAPRPVLRARASARLLVVGQAPGTRVHETGIPWNDPSGDRLRNWLQVDREFFYDESRVAIIPMGFCYPGKGRSGDLPPRPECARQWRESLLACLPDIELTLLIGQYAQQYHIPEAGKSVTETVQRWREFAPACIPTPHPSPRNLRWLERNPWFEQDLVPELRRRIRKIFPELPEPEQSG